MKVYIKSAIANMFDYPGRASRSEYWWFIAFVIAAIVCFSFIGFILEGRSNIARDGIIFVLLAIIFGMLCRVGDRGQNT